MEGETLPVTCDQSGVKCPFFNLVRIYFDIATCELDQQGGKIIFEVQGDIDPIVALSYVLPLAVRGTCDAAAAA
jgi:hypothetical protein